MNVSSGMCLRFDTKAFCSPVYLKKSKSQKAEVNSKCVCVTSTVGRLNLPDLEKMFPRSVIESIGETVGLRPPSLSDSAKLRHMRNSYKESPPNAAPRNTPSGHKLSLQALNVASISLTQCKLQLFTIRSSPSLGKDYAHFVASPSSITMGIISLGRLIFILSKCPFSCRSLMIS